MKKTILIAVLAAMSLSATVAFAQEVQTKKNKNNIIQTEASSSIGDLQVETKKFLLNIKISDGTTVLSGGFTLKPNENYSRMYLNGNWGTLDKKVQFSPDIKSNIVQFVVAYRVVKVGDVYKLYEEGVPCSNMKEFIGKNIFEDVIARKILATAEFVNSFGEKVKKDIEINFDQNSGVAGDDIFAEAVISDDDLGLNVIKLSVDVQKVIFPFSLQNKEYGINMVINPNDSKKTTEVSALAGRAMPDGIYKFVCRMGLPNGIQKEEVVEAFVVNNEISLNSSTFNPLSFVNGDYGMATFKGKVTLVKFRNNRSSSITIFVPVDYVAKRSTFVTGESEIKTEAFNKDNPGWVSYVIPPGGTVKIKMKVSMFPVVVYDINRKNSEILSLGLTNRNFQTVEIKWGGNFSLSSR